MSAVEDKDLFANCENELEQLRERLAQAQRREEELLLRYEELQGKYQQAKMDLEVA